MKKLFFIGLLLTSIPTFNAINLDTLKPNLEKIMLYCKRCDDNNKYDKNIFIQPVISMIIAKKNDQFNSWLHNENKKNCTKYVQNHNQYYDISDNINVILLFKYVAELYNTDILKTLNNRYKKCYERENIYHNILSKITHNKLDTEYTLSENEIDEKFEKYLEKLVKDISE